MKDYKNILILEFKNCIKGKKFRFVVCFLILILQIGFLLSCKEYYNNNLSDVRSAYDMGFLRGIQYGVIRLYIVSGLPLICSIIYSDSLLIEYNSGVYKSIITRIDKKKYLISKIIVIFTVVFLTIFITLIINELLCLIAFPLKGVDGNYSIPSYDIGYQNYSPEWFLDVLRLQCPYIYNLIYTFFTSLFGALFATLTYSISLVVKWKRIFVLSFVFIVQNIYERILPWKLTFLRTSNLIISLGYKVNIYFFILLVSLILIPQIILLHKGLKRELY